MTGTNIHITRDTSPSSNITADPSRGVMHRSPPVLSRLFGVSLLMRLGKHREVIGTAKSRLKIQDPPCSPAPSTLSPTYSPNYLLEPTERPLIFMERLRGRQEN